MGKEENRIIISAKDIWATLEQRTKCNMEVGEENTLLKSIVQKYIVRVSTHELLPPMNNNHYIIILMGMGIRYCLNGSKGIRLIVRDL